jgi:YVTN family beta-propeller protein
MLCIGIVLAAFAGLSYARSPSAGKPAAPARIYVTNQLDNTASVIDGATHKIVATVRVGVSPAQMAVSPDRKSVYIANTGSNTVSVLNTDNNSIARTIALPPRSRPVDLAVSPNGRYLYITGGGSNRVSVLDTRAKHVVASVRVGAQPLSIAAAPDGKTVYTANSGSGDVSVIDAQTNRVVRAIPTGRFPSGVAVTPNGASLYVTNELSRLRHEPRSGQGHSHRHQDPSGLLHCLRWVIRHRPLHRTGRRQRNLRGQPGSEHAVGHRPAHLQGDGHHRDRQQPVRHRRRPAQAHKRVGRRNDPTGRFARAAVACTTAWDEMGKGGTASASVWRCARSGGGVQHEASQVVQA